MLNRAGPEGRELRDHLQRVLQEGPPTRRTVSLHPDQVGLVEGVLVGRHIHVPAANGGTRDSDILKNSIELIGVEELAVIITGHPFGEHDAHVQIALHGRTADGGYSGIDYTLEGVSLALRGPDGSISRSELDQGYLYFEGLHGNARYELVSPTAVS